MKKILLAVLFLTGVAAFGQTRPSTVLAQNTSTNTIQKVCGYTGGVPVLCNSLLTDSNGQLLYNGGAVGGGVAASSGITPLVGGPLTSTATGTIQNLKRINALYIIGHSFARGFGVTDYALTYAGLLARDTPAVMHNPAVAGVYTNQFVSEALGTFDPNPSLISASIVSGAENDSVNDICGGTAGTVCLKHYALNDQALIAWLTLPMANRTFTNSGFCTRTGTWAVFTSPYLALSPNYTWVPQITGFNSYQPSTTGTMTCAVPTPSTATRIGLNYAPTNGVTSSFTVSVDGTLQTDQCSGTTTWSAAPCTAFVNATTGLYRQEFAVSAATTHTVVITYTHATGDASFQSVDYSVPNSAANNVVMQLADNPAWANYAVYNAQISSVIAAFQADGLPVSYIDTTNGVTYNGQTYLVNGTTDVQNTATALCPATTVGSHPNACGHEHYREAIQAAEYNARAPDGSTGFVFSSPNLVNNPASASNEIANGPIMTREPFTAALTAASTMTLTNSMPFGTVHITGATIITSLRPWQICLEGQYVDCEVTLIFDTAGGGVTDFGAPVYGFSQAFSAPNAGMAVRFTWSASAQKWYPLQSTMQGYATTFFLPNPAMNYQHGNFNKLVLTQNSTLTATNIQPGQTMYVQICEDATGGRTLTWSTGFSGATAISTTASTCNDYVFTAWTAGNFQQMSAAIGVAP